MDNREPKTCDRCGIPTLEVTGICTTDKTQSWLICPNCAKTWIEIWWGIRHCPADFKNTIIKKFIEYKEVGS